MTSRKLHLLFATLALLCGIAMVPGATAIQGTPQAQAAAPEYGPAKGTLVIVGGGSTEGTTIIEKFIELGGGPDGKFVIVPTAGGNRGADGSVTAYQEATVTASWIKRGLKNVRMLHTHDPKVADTEEFAKVLRDATAVWFNGGRQWNIVDSYAGTLTYREFHKVLERGGVIAGSSAGATIQGEYLVRGDTSGPNVVMTEEKHHQKGFEFLRKVRHRPAHQRAESLGRPDPGHQEVPEPARHRPVRGHGHHREGRHLRSDGQVEGRGARQHAVVPAVGEAVLRAESRRRVRHEGAQGHEVRRRHDAVRPTRRRRWRDR